MIKGKLRWAIAGTVLAGGFAAAPPGAKETQYLHDSELAGVSRAVAIPDQPLVYTSLLLPWDTRNRTAPAGEIAMQVEDALGSVERALAEAGSDLERVVRLNVYVADSEVTRHVETALSRRFRGRVRPVVSLVQGRLIHPEARVAMDAVATSDGENPAGVGWIRSNASAETQGVSQAAILPAGSKVFISGRAEPGDLRQATRATLRRLSADLEFAGLSLRQVGQLKAFVNPIGDYRVVQEEVLSFFRDEAPPVVYVEWHSASRPVEIELVAWAGDRGTLPIPIEYLTPPENEPSPLFSRLARVRGGPLVFVTGLVSSVDGDGESQVRDIFLQLESILGAVDSDLEHLVKATYYVSDDISDRMLNEVRRELYNPKRPPAASKARVTGTGRPERSVTLDVIAIRRP